MKLLSLRLENFKGLRDYVLDIPDGCSISIYGDNATGKTTLFDAFCWLLWGKDSRNRKDFEIKTIGPDGQVIHRLDHAVEGVLRTKDGEVTLRRTFRENYTRKRGSTTEELTGHTTVYEVNGVPIKEKEYKEFINSLIQEDLFKLITNPLYFNEQMSWQDRRKLLVAICGEIDDATIISRHDNLQPLLEVVSKRSIDDEKKIIEKRRRAINDELKLIPPRIDELAKTLVEDTGDYDRLISRRDELSKLIDAKYKERSLITAEDALHDKERELIQLKRKLAARKDEIVASAREREAANKRKLGAYADKLDNLEGMMLLNGRRTKDAHEVLARLSKTLSALQMSFDTINATEYVDTIDTHCNVCHQPLPVEQVESVRKRAREQFNMKKSRNLRETKEAIEKAKEEFTRVEEELAGLRQKYKLLNEEYELLEKERDDFEFSCKLFDTGIDFDSDDECKQLQGAIQQSEEAVKHAELLSADRLTDIDKEIAAFKIDLAKTNMDIAACEINVKTQERIRELEEQNRALAIEYEELMQRTYLIEEFTKIKINEIENSIAENFKLARFKLFEEQINGGITECCETMFNDVPFRSLNNAARINVGLDIINTISKHYDITATVFIDNAEAVTRFIDCDSQVIRLVVNENCKELICN